MQLNLFTESHQSDPVALNRCLRSPVVAVDIETDTKWPGVGPDIDYGLSYPADVTVIGLAWLEGAEIYTTALVPPLQESERPFLLDLFRQDLTIVAHNAVFDMRQLSRLTNGLIPRRIWDTQSMARLLSPKVDLRYSLTGVALDLGLAIPAHQLNMKTQRAKLHLLPLDQQVAYAEADARLALEIYQRQQDLVQDETLVDWEIRAVYQYARMAARGIRLNQAYVSRYLEELQTRRSIAVERLFKDGLQSPRDSKARAKYLYVTKGIPLPRWPEQRHFFTRAGRQRLTDYPKSQVTFSDLSTKASVIEAYLSETSSYSDALRDLAQFQELDWLVSTLEGLEKHAVVDQRLHSLVTISTDTGRRVSTNPHMQNWKMPEMAGVAIGDEGTTLVEVDYRNAENIMAAFLSGDNHLAAACATEDFHVSMAAEYFGDRWHQADADERKRLRNWSKKITYGTNYGMGASALGRSIGVSESEARQLMLAKDRAFPKVTSMRNRAQKKVEAVHELKLWTGRPVAVPSAFVAWNYLCQGGVSEMIKRAIVRLSESYSERGMRSRVALDMHDALIIEVDHQEWDVALEMATQVMTTITPARLNDRTTPPIRWRAEPDLEENLKKWGARQWHPDGN